MSDLLSYIFSSAALWLWIAAAIAVAAMIYIRHDSFALTDLTYRFPLIGKLARFSRDYSETRRGGWLNVEASLCHDYARHVTALPKADFERNIEYLRKAYDHGRRPMPPWIFLLLSLLVMLEGLGFSYLLGSWMALESTANERLWLTAAIVIVLAAILVWVTHSAGHQLYRTRLLRSCFQQFQASTIQTDTADGKPKVFSSEIVSLGQDQAIDEKYPAHVQCANRVITRPDDLGSYAWVLLAGALVLIIAVASVILRIETLHSSNVLSTQILPGTAAGGNRAAIAAALENAALASFAILSVIFIVTQMVGMGVGYWYGFAGKQSKEAYRATGGCADYDSYFAPIRRKMSIADLRLATLHRLMEKRLPHDIDWTLADGRERNFLEFVRDQRSRGATDLQDPTDLDAPAAASPGTNGSHPPDGADPPPPASIAPSALGEAPQDVRPQP